MGMGMGDAGRAGSGRGREGGAWHSVINVAMLDNFLIWFSKLLAGNGDLYAAVAQQNGERQSEGESNRMSKTEQETVCEWEVKAFR